MSQTDRVITIAEIDEVVAAVNICYSRFDAPGKAAALRLASMLSTLRRKINETTPSLPQPPAKP
ncbi:MAG: hypothetical protein ABSF60_14195 [Verrucomicrobiota bacterium]